MEMLNNIGMMLALNDDLWKVLITWFGQLVVNYGWAIILFTVCLKLVMSPLDILQRRTAQKQQRVMTHMQPEMEKLQQRYANDKEKLNQESAKLYKKYNVSLGGMCLPLLLTMVLSMVVMFTLYSSLRAYGNEKLYVNYQQLEAVYEKAVDDSNKTTFEGDKQEYVYEIVKDAYADQQKENSWLWVKNVWKSDTNVDQLADFDGYAAYSNCEKDSEEYTQRLASYNAIKAVVEKENPGQNGYYILIILSALITFLTQFATSKIMQQKGQKMGSMNMIMFIVIPVTMLILAMTSNVVFTLYIIINSIMSLLITMVINAILKKKNKDDDNGNVVYSNKKVEVVEYSRNYKK